MKPNMAANGGPNLRQSQSPYAVFHVNVYSKNCAYIYIYIYIYIYMELTDPNTEISRQKFFLKKLLWLFYKRIT